MDKDASAAGGRRIRSGLVGRSPAVSLAIVAGAILALEALRLAGIRVPVPFMFVYVGVALAATFSGLRTGLAATALAGGYGLYAWLTGAWPGTLAGGLLPLTVATALAAGAAALLGYEHDVRMRLLGLLLKRERRLRRIREQLSGNVAEASAALEARESELSHARQRLDQALRLAPVGVLVVGTERDVRFMNDAALHQCGIDPSTGPPASWHDLVRRVAFYDADDVLLKPPHGPVSRALAAGEIRENYDMRIVGLDGESRYSTGYVGPIRDVEERITGAIAILVDRTRERETSRALDKVTRLLFRVQEEERGMLARELHEEIAQSLAAIKFRLQSSGEEPAGGVADSMARIDDLTSTIRQLSLELRPHELDDFGLASAVSAQLERLENSTGVTCRLDVEGDLAGVSDETATVAYRIVQEAVDNAARHARAEAISVGLRMTGERLEVAVEDDGDGFDVDGEGERSTHEGHLGLLFMRERARQYGGAVSIVSGDGHGTMVRAELPLSSGDQHAENETGPRR